MAITLVTGGARSGKSRHAEEIVLRLARQADTPPVYIATAEAFDHEMEARIAQHRSRREGDNWHTFDAPLALVESLNHSDTSGPRLVDCLTLWLSNLMHHQRDWERETDALCDALCQQTTPVVLVTNEVGGGIVPENALARRFRDYAGLLNQKVARTADHVILCVAGYPMTVK
ncbi:MAG: bifunctional adenosylcobinamide kinase/adenosylcobinamide-phosphate guanylyltransferase [Pseudomonadota bacterium]